MIVCEKCGVALGFTEGTVGLLSLEDALARAEKAERERDAWQEACVAMAAIVERAAQDGDPTVGRTWSAVRAFLKYRAAEGIRAALRPPAPAPAPSTIRALAGHIQALGDAVDACRKTDCDQCPPMCPLDEARQRAFEAAMEAVEGRATAPAQDPKPGESPTVPGCACGDARTLHRAGKHECWATKRDGAHCPCRRYEPAKNGGAK